MTPRQGPSWIATVGLLALASFGPPAANAAQPPSCVCQFVIANAPHGAGGFGGFVRDAAQTTEPNLGVSDVAPDASSDHSNCS